MEFSELIQIRDVDEVQVRSPKSQKARLMRLTITIHHSIFRPNTSQDNNNSSRASTRRTSRKGVKEIWLLHRNVDRIERRASTNTSKCSLIIKCKNLAVYSLELAKSELFNQLAETLEKLAAIEDISHSFAFFYRPPFANNNALDPLHETFTTESEYRRLFGEEMNKCNWRVSKVNAEFAVCRSYPRHVIVPKSISDDQLRMAAAFRQGGRFPVLCHKHHTGEVLLRSSQPLCGASNRRCRSDEQLLQASLGASGAGFVMDTRTAAAASSEKSKGGGFESTIVYTNWRRMHKAIDRYHFLLESYARVVDACLETNMDRFMAKMAASCWLTHVKDVLNAACLVAQCLDKEKASVLVHGSEGLDITLCVTSLAQIILCSDCRTVSGLQALIEREWIQAGHPFWSRTTKGGCSDSVASKSRHQAPTFVLFLDCLAQIIRQFPRAFEFDDNLLVIVLEHAYASNFGSFLCDSEYERHVMQTRSSTASLWHYLEQSHVRQTFVNHVYRENCGCIWPNVAPVNLTLWSSWFLRWSSSPWSHLSLSEATSMAAQRILSRNKEARLNVERLRSKLVALRNEAIALGIWQETDNVGDKVEDECGDDDVFETPRTEQNKSSK